MDEDPLSSGSARAFERLLEAMGPASLLVVIESRMSAALRAQLRAEDILQEALLHAWRDRKSCQWRGLPAYRAWFLQVIRNRIHDAADRVAAAKRGGGLDIAQLSVVECSGGDSEASAFQGPVVSTTPSRAASLRERAAAMRAALAGLPEGLREVVRLRLFEELSTEETARRLDLGLSAVKHRFRKGAALYRELLRTEMVSRSDRGPAEA